MAWLRLLLAPVLLLGVLWMVDSAAVLDRIAQARPGWLLAALACAVASNLASAWRWRALVHWLGHGLGMWAATRLTFQSIAVGTLLPGAVVGGDLYRAVSMRSRGMATLPAGLSVLLDRLSGLWMLWVQALLAAAWGWPDVAPALAAWGVPSMGAALPAGLALAALAAPAVVLALARGWRLPGRLGRLTDLARRPRLAAEFCRQLLASAVVQLLSVGALACGGQALGVELPYALYAVAAAPTFLMAALPVSFGGWGTREAAAALSLAPFGVAAPAAVAVSMLYGALVLPQALAGAALLARRAAPGAPQSSSR